MLMTTALRGTPAAPEVMKLFERMPPRMLGRFVAAVPSYSLPVVNHTGFLLRILSLASLG
jgi:hypothetical protein